MFQRRRPPPVKPALEMPEAAERMQMDSATVAALVQFEDMLAQSHTAADALVCTTRAAMDTLRENGGCMTPAIRERGVMGAKVAVEAVRANTTLRYTILMRSASVEPSSRSLLPRHLSLLSRKPSPSFTQLELRARRYLG